MTATTIMCAKELCKKCGSIWREATYKLSTGKVLSVRKGCYVCNHKNRGKRQELARKSYRRAA